MADPEHLLIVKERVGNNFLVWAVTYFTTRS